MPTAPRLASTAVTGTAVGTASTEEDGTEAGQTSAGPRGSESEAPPRGPRRNDQVIETTRNSGIVERPEDASPREGLMSILTFPVTAAKMAVDAVLSGPEKSGGGAAATIGGTSETGTLGAAAGLQSTTDESGIEGSGSEWRESGRSGICTDDEV